MLESEFEIFLTNDKSIKSKKKAVDSRMSKARAVEKMLERSLDVIVQSEKDMYDALCVIDANMNNRNGAYSNALRKYYTFRKGKVFPRIAEYEKKK
jgi:hypothetical protein